MTVCSDGSIFASANGDGVFRSTDNGVTWDQLNKGISDRFLTAIAAHPNGDLFAGGRKIIFKSIDNGLNWNPLAISFPPSATVVRAITIDKHGNIIAGVDSAGILISSDNGTSWSDRSIGLTATKVNALVATEVGKIFAATDSGIFYLSSSTATQWLPYSLGLTDKNILSLCIDDAGFLYAGSAVSGVYSSFDSFGTTTHSSVAIKNNGGSMGVGELYPNPASESISIEINVSTISPINIEVIDMVGQVMFVQTAMPLAGVVRQSIDIRSLRPGAYYLKTISDSKEVKKSFIKIME